MIIERLMVLLSKWPFKCPNTMQADCIVVHNTANDAGATNEISYMINNNNPVSYHFAVDHEKAVQGVETNRNCWHAGDGGNGRGNRRGIGIECCFSMSGGPRHTAAKNNTAELVAILLKQHGWGIDRVMKHQDFMNKYCPHRILDEGWQNFLNLVQSKMSGAPSMPAPPISAGRPLLTIGSVGQAVRDCQTLLNRHGYGVSVDGQYGPLTKNAVVNFQRARGLAADGMVGNITWSALDQGTSAPSSKITRVLSRGSKGEDVKTLQRKLISIGHNLGAYGDDGDFGPITENAVRKTQQQMGISVDGMAGPQTLGRLGI